MWQISYHETYLKSKNEFDPHLIQWIDSKERIIQTSPISHPFLKKPLFKIRKFRSGKLRILYALSTERPELWKDNPPDKGVILLFCDLRTEETYDEVLKEFKKHGIV